MKNPQVTVRLSVIEDRSYAAAIKRLVADKRPGLRGPFIPPLEPIRGRGR